MIHLDTNYLIRSELPGSFEAKRIRQWLISGEDLAASAIAWSEFLTGPVPEIDVQLAHRLVAGRIVAFDSVAAALSADLFYRIGRRRREDSMR